jgi:hypothetical protein
MQARVAMKRTPITAIEELLKYDGSYLAVTPVVLFDRSVWQKFVGLFIVPPAVKA